MRGDSLRDFYAKTLAVVGLGLLAGAGAIVDYWPVDGPLPAVSDVANVNVPAPVALPSNIPAQVVHRAARPVVAVATLPVPEPLPSIDAAPMPPPIVMSAATPAPEPAVIAIRVDCSTPMPGPSLSLADLGPMPQLATGDAVDQSHGILADAIRKTKASLRGARWFLGDKIQGVIGAFRKVSPFWDATTVPLR